MDRLTVRLLFAAETWQHLKHLVHLYFEGCLGCISAMNLNLVNNLKKFLDLVQIKHHLIGLFLIRLFNFHQVCVVFYVVEKLVVS